MSNRVEREAEDNYEAENDAAPIPDEIVDDTYLGETNPNLTNQVPVQADEDDYEDPMQPPYANTDEQLADDDNEAIDQSNILKGDRLRHGKPRSTNRYSEGPNEDDLPSDIRDGLSGVSGLKRLS
ncbi:hypothetical protein N7474_003571 [Penicillium riverlandense]|uniref:uncharacterized protein n=1 Tax=Penicillium riverlandense TaxID=1903569 RepID=UPI002547756D|nr:uncharacterized protein N7474_003571 [Penicillium riverlandense]KAJ5826433.1 hypothetical protein N7474_003571 [Penicillium riverlandense]